MWRRLHRPAFAGLDVHAHRDGARRGRGIRVGSLARVLGHVCDRRLDRSADLFRIHVTPLARGRREPTHAEGGKRPLEREPGSPAARPRQATAEVIEMKMTRRLGLALGAVAALGLFAGGTASSSMASSALAAGTGAGGSGTAIACPATEGAHRTAGCGGC